MSEDDLGAPILPDDVLQPFRTRNAVPLHMLEAHFLVPTDKGSRLVDAITEARGLWFACPKCFMTNRGLRGTHYVLCWDPSVPLSVTPGPGRWNLVGMGLADLTLVAGSSSILLQGGCAWHGFVRNGEATLS